MTSYQGIPKTYVIKSIVTNTPERYYSPKKKTKMLYHNKKEQPICTEWHIGSLFILMRLGFLDIIHNPLSYFCCSVTLTAFYLNFRRTYVGIQRRIYSLTDQSTFLF